MYAAAQGCRGSARSEAPVRFLHASSCSTQAMQYAMKRVAIFRADLLPISETFVRDQASALNNWQPVLLGRREVAAGLETPGIPREIVPETRNGVAGAVRFWLCRPDQRLVEQLRAAEVDLVHAHFGTNATEVWPSVKAAGLPMLVTLHGYDINVHRTWWERGHAGVRSQIYPRRLLIMARDPAVRFVAVSQAVKRRAMDYGIDEKKISLAHIGVDMRRFGPGEVPLSRRSKRILFVGRMVEKKAPLLLIRVYSELRKELPEAELAMIGEGPLLAAAKRLAAELGAPVEFLGARRSQDVLAQMHKAKVFCLPSITAANGDAEGLPISLLEAQACGVPVVTTDSGGTEEALKRGVTGFACKEGAVQEFVAGLRRVLTDDQFAARAAIEAPRFVSGMFDIRECTRKLELEYDRLALPGRPAGPTRSASPHSQEGTAEA